MDRRSALIALLATCALARAQSPERMRVVGVVMEGTVPIRPLSAAMAKYGWLEGVNIRYEFRSIASDLRGIDEAVAGLVRGRVDVLMGAGVPIMTALSRATRTIPIVCAGVSDPVEVGIARSLREPGGNVTGISYGLPEAAALQLGTLRALAPALKRVVFVTAPDDFYQRADPAHEAAARVNGLTTDLVKVADFRGLERAIDAMTPSDAVWLAFLPADATEAKIAAAFLRRRIATHVRPFGSVSAGFLMSYWTAHVDRTARIAAILDKVLRGADPARIPFELPDSTRFALNRTTATALGLRVPPEILARVTDMTG